MVGGTLDDKCTSFIYTIKMSRRNDDKLFSYWLQRMLKVSIGNFNYNSMLWRCLRYISNNCRLQLYSFLHCFPIFAVSLCRSSRSCQLFNSSFSSFAFFSTWIEVFLPPLSTQLTSDILQPLTMNRKCKKISLNCVTSKALVMCFKCAE